MDFFNMARDACLARPRCVMLANTDLHALMCRMGTVFPATTNQVILHISAAALRLISTTVHSSATQAISQQMEAASNAALSFANLGNTDPNATVNKMGNVCHVQTDLCLASFLLCIIESRVPFFVALCSSKA